MTSTTVFVAGIIYEFITYNLVRREDQATCMIATARFPFRIIV